MVLNSSFGFTLREAVRKSSGLALLVFSLPLFLFSVHGAAIPAPLLLQSETEKQAPQEVPQIEKSSEVTALEPGKPIERALAGWHRHTYHLSVIQGQYVNVTVEQRGIDLSIQLRGVDGSLIAEFDFESRNDGRENVEFVAEASGNYRVEIKPTLKNAPTRRYEIRLAEARVASERDRSLYEATKLFAEAGRLYEADKHVDALPLAERASQILEQALGTENQEFARTINLVANLYSGKKDYAKAEPIFQRALEIRERVLGPEHPDVAASCYDLGRFYLATGDRAKGEPFSQRALAIRENVLDSNHFYIGLTLSNYARYPYYRQEYAEAEEIFSRAASILQKSLGDDHPDYSAALHSLGFIHDTTGDFAKAELLYRRELASREKARGKDSGQAAYVLHYIARVYFKRGEYDEAEALYQRALDIDEKLHDEEGILVALANLAGIQAEKGDYDRAEALYKQILERHEKAASPNQINITGVLLNLGATKNNQGDYASAEPFLRRALSIIEGVRKGDGLDLAHVLRTLGSTNIGKGDYTTAEQLCRRALAIYERVNGPNHPYVAWVLNKLGQIAYLKGDYSSAESSYSRALAISEKSQGMNNPELVGPLKSLADVYAAKGDPAQAIEFQSRANAVSEHHLALALATGSERQKLAYLATSASNIDRDLTLNLRSAPVNARASELAVTMLLQLKGRVLDSMTDTLSALRSRANPKDKQLLDQLNETTTQLARRVLNASQAIVSAENQAQIKALEEKREKLEDEISRRSAEFRAQKQAVTLDSVRRTIPERAALLEFVIYRPHNPRTVNDKAAYGESRYAVCVIRSHGEALWKELGAAKEIDTAIKGLRLALRDPKRKDAQQISRGVDEKVMQPIRGLLGEATQLFVSPDGELNLIPFAALVDERGRYLIERYSFTYLSSGRDLLRLQVARASKSNPIVLANPTFGEPDFVAIARDHGPKPQQASLHRKRQSVTTGSDLSDVYFAPLDGTEREAQSIKSLFPEMTLLTGGAATEARLKQAAAPRILHIATHGFFLTDEQPATDTRGTRAISTRTKIENPLLRSGLALVGANLRSNTGDDGILTALEAAGLNLWGTKLVVLSACDTGVGEVKNGEGVYGLRRALVLAGAETLVMSLWPVSDHVTREMMTAYYTGLKQGQGRGEALRQVQLSMLKRNGREHPFYWASFIQSGEWANLEAKR